MKRYFVLFSFSIVCSLSTVRGQNVPNTATMPAGAAGVISLPDAYDTSQNHGFYNYVESWVPGVAVSDTTSSLFKLSSSNHFLSSTKYLNGWGQGLEAILHGTTSTGDMISFSGIKGSMTSISFLPYNIAQNSGFQFNPFGDQRSALSSGGLFPNEGGATYGMSVTDFSGSSPTISAAAPGQSFVGANRKETVTTTINDPSTDPIPVFYINPSGVLSSDGTNYALGQLSVHTSNGVHGEATTSYTNKSGQEICKRIYAGLDATSTPINQTTYYVYNDLGKIAAIIPPNAVASYPGYIYAGLFRLIYTYTYDQYGHLIERKVPDKKYPEQTVYDARQRAVLMRSPLLQDQGQWAFTIYDKMNRPVFSGLLSDTSGRATWQNLANGTTAPAGGITTGSLLDFIVNGFNGSYPASIASCVINTLNYYDSYPSFSTSFNDSSSSDYLTVTGDIRPVPYLFTQGMLTATQTRIVDPTALIPGWVQTTYFYDQKGHVIQTQTLNPWNTVNKDVTTMQYNFLGQEVFDITKHYSWAASDKNPTIIRNYSNYDGYFHRINSIQQKIDGGALRDIATYTYDALGRVSRKVLGGVEVQDYNYNIRGQLTAINSNYVYNPVALDKTFGCVLDYDYGFTQPRYDGKIAGMIWRGAGSGAPLRAYGYSYDLADRLTDADFRESTRGTWSKSSSDMSMNGVTYDQNGNMLTMNQMGNAIIRGHSTPTQIDQLNYTYGNANQLISVSDGIKTDYGIGDFQDVTPSCSLSSGSDAGDAGGPPPEGVPGAPPPSPTSICPDYYYDADGNLIADSNKHIISISYNEFAQPVSILTQQGTVTNIYVGGTLTQKTIVDTISGTPHTDVYRYWGSAVYRNDSLLYVLHSEGRARWLPDSSLFKYDFFVKDHLGNVRTVVTSDESAPINYFAGHELASAHLESSIFANIPMVRDLKPGSTNPYDVDAADLNGSDPNRRIGTAILLNVMAGDKFDISAESYWSADSSDLTDNINPSDMLGAITSTLIGGAGGYSNDANAAAYVNNLFTSSNYLSMYQGIVDSLTDDSIPKAYINYLVFDAQMNLIPSQSGAIQVSGTPGNWQALGTTSPIDIGQNGYVSIFMSNAASMEVYMDRLSINYYQGRLLHEEHYYPHGLAVEQGLGNGMPNYYLFQTNEVHKEIGVNQSDFNFRQYDYQIGRFTGIDPLADAQGQEVISPYHGFANDPANFVDPMGLGNTNNSEGNGAVPVQQGSPNSFTNDDFWCVLTCGDNWIYVNTSRENLSNGGGGGYRPPESSYSTVVMGNTSSTLDDGGINNSVGTVGDGGIGGNVSTWQPLYKSDLLRYYQQMHAGGYPTANQLGATFEGIVYKYLLQDAALTGLKVYPNINIFTDGNDRNTVPDFVGDMERILDGEPMVIPQSAWYEAKAKGGGLYLSSNSYQVMGHITNLANKFALYIGEAEELKSNWRPILFLMTTADVPFSPSIAAFARKRDIYYSHYYATFKQNNGNWEFSFNEWNW